MTSPGAAINTLDAGRGVRIMQAYDELPLTDEEARSAFTHWALEERAQFLSLAQAYCIEPWPLASAPYINSEAMRKDLAYSRHLYVFIGGEAHPCRTSMETYIGRAVHDILGHGAVGADFSPDGELTAFRAQARHYSAAALPALASDNLGSACYYYYHPKNIDQPRAKRTWPAQKMALLPEHLWRELL